ncbi:MAG: DoxX family protein [Propioniciclava sp.]
MADERIPEDDVVDGAEPARAVMPDGDAYPLTPASPVALLEDEPADVAYPADPRVDAAGDSVRRERARLQAEREARRAAREAALRPRPERRDPVAVARAAQDDSAAVDPLPPVRERVATRRSTDTFAPSLALFLLRLVVAVILGVRGITTLLQVQQTSDLIATTILPAPGALAIVLGVAEVAIAVALVFGFLTRIAGLGVLIIAASALAFVLWGPWSPFVAGEPGFTGELEVLLAGVGFLFMSIGGGAWALDRGFRARRAVRRLDEAG